MTLVSFCQEKNLKNIKLMLMLTIFYNHYWHAICVLHMIRGQLTMLSSTSQNFVITFVYYSLHHSCFGKETKACLYWIPLKICCRHLVSNWFFYYDLFFIIWYREYYRVWTLRLILSFCGWLFMGGLDLFIAVTVKNHQNNFKKQKERTTFSL